MAILVPTVTETEKAAFHARILQLAHFSPYIHIDFADGDFAPSKLVDVAEASWPDSVKVDLHVMYQFPLQVLDTLIELSPGQVTIHAEASGDLMHMVETLKTAGIAVGVALLPESQVSNYALLIEQADVVLIFGGHLGYQGGTIDLSQLSKVEEIRAINSKAHIAWDGGITPSNAPQLVESGIDVLNVGSAISKAKDPEKAYQKFKAVLA